MRKLDPKGPLVENAARIIRTRLRELRELAPAALEPGSSAEQHDLRIAAKRLRYVLETTGFVFGEPAKEARRGAREIQTVLGDLHDCDVMLPRVAEHAERLRAEDAAAIRERATGAALAPRAVAEAPHRTAYRGLALLEVHLEARRGLLFERFGAVWGELDREGGAWDRLEGAVRAKVRSARERRAAAQRARRAAEELVEAERAEREAAVRAREAAVVLTEARRAEVR